MLENGSWERPHRPRKRGEFVPIEEVSSEDLHPGYDIGPRTPEDVMIASEREAALEAAEGITDEEKKYQDFLDHQMESGKYDDYDAHDAFYWHEIGKFAKDVDTMDARGEDWDGLKQRYHLDPKLTREYVTRAMNKWYSTRGSHGHRGREHRGKHQKGGESLRDL